MSSPSTPCAAAKPMTPSQLRHDVRNYLNAIKLSCALLQRRNKDELSAESLREIDRSADSINELITRFTGEADAVAIAPKRV